MEEKPAGQWWQTGIIYNLYVRSFKDNNGDGIGDLTGVIEKLDYLRETLGIDILWLSGILASPWKEFGFDVSDLRALHPAFGTLETFEELLRLAHERGMKVIIDFIPNHTSNLHSWFIESSASLDSERRSWYIWRDPKPDGTPPNNWLSLFGGSAWEWSEVTGQYYLHTFLKEQPDLNWRNPQVQEAMFQSARFWLDRGVDGFRVDAAHHIIKDARFRDNPGGLEPRLINGKRMAHEYQQHLYDREQPELHRVYADLRALLDEYDPPRAAFAEIHPSGGWKDWATYYGKKNRLEFHFPFNNGLISAAYNAGQLRQIVDDIEAALPAHGWPNAHSGNFDEWRIATRFGQAGARLMAMLLLTLRGTPLLYYGEEIGMTNAAISPEYQRDPFGKRLKLSRDPQRTPMQWDSGPHAGFSAHTTPALWLPVNSNYRTVNVESELGQSSSMLNLYRDLIRLRRSLPALVMGSYHPLDSAPADTFTYLRKVGQERLLIALNFSEEAQHFPLKELQHGGEVLLSTTLEAIVFDPSGQIHLRPHEGQLINLGQ